jgi:hypothetical protein
MVINLGDFIIAVKPVFIIYPVMFCLFLISIAAVVGFIWVCLTPGGDPLFNIPRIQRSGRREARGENAEAL